MIYLGVSRRQPHWRAKGGRGGTKSGKCDEPGFSRYGVESRMNFLHCRDLGAVVSRRNLPS